MKVVLRQWGVKTVCVDIGSGFTKGICGQKEVVFPSSVGLLTNSVESEDYERNGIVEVRGERFATGKTAELIFRSHELISSLTEEWAFCDGYRALLYRAIADLLPGGYSGRLNIGTGLPLAYIKRKSELQQRLIGKHSFKCGPHNYEININSDKNCFIIPQVVGLYHSSELTSNVCGVIDVGTFTTGYVVIDSGRPIAWACGGFEVGISHIINGVCDRIVHTFGKKIDKKRMLNAMVNKFIEIDGAKIPLEELIQIVAMEKFGELIKDIRNKWNEIGDMEVIVGGGGSDLVMSVIKSNFWNAKQNPNGILGIVKGYSKLVD